MTYSEMVDSVTRLASALRKRGLKVGDSVLMMATNSIEIALSIFSVMKAGGASVSTTLNLFPGNESRILFKSGIMSPTII